MIVDMYVEEGGEGRRIGTFARTPHNMFRSCRDPFAARHFIFPHLILDD